MKIPCLVAVCVFVCILQKAWCQYPEPRCFEPYAPGPCLGYFFRVFFDVNSGTCQQFLYGGCLGNGNNFDTMDECLFSCVLMASDSQNSGGGGELAPPAPPQTTAPAWRDDLRCGEGYTAPNGQVAQCDPDGQYPCCSTAKWCGNTAAHCSCAGCIDYSGVPAWRDDLRCGEGYTAPNGEVAQCDPDGQYPCCSTAKWCGNTAAHCSCSGCIDYSG